MDKEEAVKKQQVLEDNLDQAKAELMKIPGVVAVGIGFKESNNEFTNEFSFRVYVDEKKTLASLTPSEVIPREINGIRTDVLNPLIITNDSDVCGSEIESVTVRRPLTAGIAISTDSTSYGTLGWFGKLTDGTTVLLTNKHVLYDITNKTDSRKLKTAQPQLGDPSTCCCCTCGSDNVIGESIIGIRDITPGTNTSVDCAIAKINADVAATIKLKITNPATTQVLTVAGTAVAVVGDQVRKIGARSAFTRGEVVHLGDIAVAAPTDANAKAIVIQQGQVLIIPIAAETYEVKETVCKRAFSNSGDSGAVILNAANQIIALNWGGDRITNAVGITVASHIQNVLDKLSAAGFNVTLSTSPSGGDMRATRVNLLENTDESIHLLQKIRDANKESLLYWLYEKHHKEIIRLINESRPVTVAWQRNQGPAYVAAIARAARETSYKIPLVVNECSREQLLLNLEKQLLLNGSEGLKKDIIKFRDDLVNSVTAADSIETLAEALKDAGFIDAIPFITTQNLV